MELVTQPEKRPAKKQVYDFAEGIEMLGLGRSTAQELLRRGELPVQPVRIGHRWKFTKAAMDRFLGIEDDD